MKVTEAIYAWTPRHDFLTDHKTYGMIEIVPWPDTARLSDKYMMTAGACFARFRTFSPEILRPRLLSDWHAIVVRDNIDPHAAHQAFLSIDEYRWWIAPDVQGAAVEHPDDRFFSC